jgi:hypothetical protein
MAFLVRRHRYTTFDHVKADVLRQLESNRERMSKNRKSNVEYIEKDLGVPLKQYDLVNITKQDEGWMKIKNIIMGKL